MKVGTKASSIILRAVTLAATLGTLACQNYVDIYRLNTGTEVATTATWHGPYGMDLGDVRDPLAATFYSTNSYDPTNVARLAVPLTTATSTSFADYRMKFSQTLGGLVASVYDGAKYRTLGRIYSPYSLGGTGWAAYGPQSGFLDSGLYDYTNLALGIDATGSLFSVFGEGAAVPNATRVAQAGYGSTGAWGSFTPTVPAAFVDAPATGHPFNGYSSDIGWDIAGHAYYGFKDINGIGHLRDYSAFSTWDSTNLMGLRLSSGTTQVQVLPDGFGATAVWLGNETVLASEVWAGATSAYALTTSGVRGWGDNTYGQTGVGATSVSPKTTAVPMSTSASLDFNIFSGGGAHACAVTNSHILLCWGQNASGQIGTGNVLTPQAAPITVTLPNSELPSTVAAGGSHTCAANTARKVYCWGDDLSGALGDADNAAGSTILVPTAAKPVVLEATGAPVSDIEELAAGLYHSCSRDSNGAVLCWGENGSGQLGDGTLVDKYRAVPVALPADAAQITARNELSCARLVDDTVYCWGDNVSGQIGSLSPADQNTPTQVPLGLPAGETVTSVSAGGFHACALTSLGRVICWGNNTQGQMGDGGVVVTPAPPMEVPLPPGVKATRLASGYYFNCIATTAGNILCWGKNDLGQIGVGTIVSPQLTPTEALISASTTKSLRSVWSADNSFLNVKPLSTGDTKTSASASDDQGNVVTVFLQAIPNFPAAPAGTITTTLPLRENDVRVFASTRSASGIWSGPSQLDDPTLFDPYTTTHYQLSLGSGGDPLTVAGGIDYYTPAVTYVGSGRFLVAFAVTDLVGSVSAIYTRGYTVGSGWDSASLTHRLDSMSIPVTAAEAFRYANDLTLVSNGQGDAMLMAHVVVPSGTGYATTLRNYGIKVYRYTAATDTWSAPFLIPNSICRANTTAPSAVPTVPYLCWNAKPTGAVFADGEAVVVYPAPAATSGTYSGVLRLFSMEFHL